MPGFIGHTVGNTVVAAGTTAFMAWQGWSIQDILAVDAGIAISTLVLSPDMDLFNSKSMDGWGWLRFFWWPYAKLVKHRDRLHFPFFGTAVRWGYVLGILLLFVIIFRLWARRVGLEVHLDFAGDTDDIIYNLLYLVDIFIGAILADTTHYILDIVSTHLKRMMPRRYRERYARYIENHQNPNNARRLPRERGFISEGDRE